MPTTPAIPAETVQEWVAAGRSLNAAAHDAIEGAMLRLRAHSPWSADHSERVGEYTRGYAEALGLPAPAVEALAQAARLHDVGKSVTPHAVLDKPGALDAAERREMNDHTTHGATILSTLPGLPASFRRLAVDVAEGHHERFAGGGYPLNRAGADIPSSARLVALADVFDALSAARTYKPARSVSDTLSMMTGRPFEGHFDPALQPAFTRFASGLSLDAAVLQAPEPATTATATPARRLQDKPKL